jgi:hypothetical protein
VDLISGDLECLEGECETDVLEAERDAAICCELSGTSNVEDVPDNMPDNKSPVLSKGKEKEAFIEGPSGDEGNGEAEIDCWMKKPLPHLLVELRFAYLRIQMLLSFLVLF